MQPIDETVQVLEALARPGCTVADLCAGSATSAIGCIRLGMRWVGCEIDPEAHKIASNRIEAELKARGGRSTPATAKV
jgi:DNA modification methylase